MEINNKPRNRRKKDKRDFIIERAHFILILMLLSIIFMLAIAQLTGCTTEKVVKTEYSKTKKIKFNGR